jgi:hypothetical protein
VVAVPYVALQLVQCSWVTQNIACTYIGFGIITVGLALFLRGGFPHWVSKRRTIEPSELEGLYSEIERYRTCDSKDQVHTEAVEQAENEKSKLESLERPIFELDALSLRQALVDAYHPTAELIAKTRGGFEYLEEYTEIEGADRVNEIIEELEKILSNGTDGEKEKQEKLERRLRAELKELHDTTAWYDRTWAIGEWMRTCVTCWICVAVVVTMLVGILPIIHSQGNWNLCIIHWAVLGSTGALLSILLGLHRLDLPELGETEGKDLLMRTILKFVIGTLTAFMLYAAIWGGAIEGQIFPDLQVGKDQFEAVEVQNQRETRVDMSSQTEQGDVEVSLKDVGLSIFWAIFAGLSPEILVRMSQVAGISLGQSKSENGTE